jgi:hypothetical protein
VFEGVALEEPGEVGLFEFYEHLIIGGRIRRSSTSRTGGTGRG